MTIKLTNTLSRKKEEFKPIKPEHVGIYTCGPTVYGTPTIGNFRSFLLADMVRRVFEFNNFDAKLVMNITDVGHLVNDGDEGEDKMIKAMRKEGKTAWEIAEFYTDEFVRDMERLNIKTPHEMPRATDHIAEQIAFVVALEKNGYTYKTSDGIYFDTSKLEDYGKLGGQKLEEKEEGARVAANPEKKNPTDFALWKFSPTDQKRDMEWESPWGVGFPGWHIECSAMSEKYLGSPFDIHTGGADLAPVHHENEIAQTRGAESHEPANYWLHGAFLQVDGGRMGKSLGNAYTIQDLIDRGFDPLAFRYFTFSAHYRSPLNFTWESLTAAQNALNNLRDDVRSWDKPTGVDEESLGVFKDRVNDDLDMPGAVAQLWAVVKDEHIDTGVKAATVLEFDRVLGLELDKYVAQPLEVPLVVRKLVEDRESARKRKDWEASDRIRDKIAEEGFVVEDTEEGAVVREKHD